jgi:hypothetical protein
MRENRYTYYDITPTKCYSSGGFTLFYLIVSKKQTVLAGVVTVAALRLQIYLVLLRLVCKGVNERLFDNIHARWQLL